jgi:hypothetical protein
VNRDTLTNPSVTPSQHILHDWDDADSVKILKSIKHAATSSGAELVIVEAVIAEPGEAHPHGAAQKTLDTLMMCIGGKERSLGEWTSLLAGGGWKLDKVRELSETKTWRQSRNDEEAQGGCKRQCRWFWFQPWRGGE